MLSIAFWALVKVEKVCETMWKVDRLGALIGQGIVNVCGEGEFFRVTSLFDNSESSQWNNWS